MGDEDNFNYYKYINTNNSCYLNSSLQLLHDIDEINVDSQTPQDNKTNYARLLEQIWAALPEATPHLDLKVMPNIYSPAQTPIYEEFLTVSDDLVYGRQEDAGEFLSNFLQKAYADKSAVKQSLKVKLRKTVLCADPSRNKIIYDKPSDSYETILKLPIKYPPEQQYTTINQLLELAQQEYLPPADDDWANRIKSCDVESSNKRVACTGLKDEIETSKNLIIQLIRYSNVNGRTSKNSAKVFPDMELHLYGKVYDLKGCIQHHGDDFKNGHYAYLTKFEQMTGYPQYGVPTKYISDNKFAKGYDPRSRMAREGYIYYYVQRTPAKALTKAVAPQTRTTSKQHVLTTYRLFFKNHRTNKQNGKIWEIKQETKNSQNEITYTLHALVNENNQNPLMFKFDVVFLPADIKTGQQLYELFDKEKSNAPVYMLPNDAFAEKLTKEFEAYEPKTKEKTKEKTPPIVTPRTQPRVTSPPRVTKPRVTPPRTQPRVTPHHLSPPLPPPPEIMLLFANGDNFYGHILPPPTNVSPSKLAALGNKRKIEFTNNNNEVTTTEAFYVDITKKGVDSLENIFKDQGVNVIYTDKNAQNRHSALEFQMYKRRLLTTPPKLKSALPTTSKLKSIVPPLQHNIFSAAPAQRSASVKPRTFFTKSPPKSVFAPTPRKSAFTPKSSSVFAPTPKSISTQQPAASKPLQVAAYKKPKFYSIGTIKIGKPIKPKLKTIRRTNRYRNSYRNRTFSNRTFSNRYGNRTFSNRTTNNRTTNNRTFNQYKTIRRNRGRRYLSFSRSSRRPTTNFNEDDFF